MYKETDVSKKYRSRAVNVTFIIVGKTPNKCREFCFLCHKHCCEMSFTKTELTSEDICNDEELLNMKLWKYFKRDCFESVEQLNACRAILKRE